MAHRHARRMQVAVVTHPGLLPLELIGTVSARNGIGLNTGFRTVTVAASREPLATDTPLRMVPQSTFAAVPHPGALLVTGGGLMSTVRAMGDDQLLAYVRAAETAELVASVGTGSLILAAAGLLTGRPGTTHLGGCWCAGKLRSHIPAYTVGREWQVYSVRGRLGGHRHGAATDS